MGKTKSHNTLEVVSEKKNPALRAGFFFVTTSFPDSKQLQLLAGCIHCFRFAIAENLHVAKLFVRNTQDANVAKLGHERFHPLDVDFGIFMAWTMPQINGKLEHREAVGHDAFAKSGISLALLFRLRRQIKKHKHPHNPIFTETIHHNSIIG
jgi:hypothetical protein